MELRVKTLILLSFWLFAWPVSSTTGQTSTSGSITGVATDKSDAVVPGVNVQLEDDAKGFRQTTTTNEEGFYQFPFLAPGSYTLNFNRTGFEVATRRIDVRLGLPATERA